ncbi:MAG: metallophosphoesterase family protein [Paracoccaceae bacterium]|nr:metallophosphoesterase family protein [Paracoccaceae bacterium]
MRILAYSDLHCDLAAAAAIVDAAADADIVVGAGDFAQNHEGLEKTMTALEPIAAKSVLVPGNNETETALRGATTARVLHGETADVAGLRIAGIGCAIPPLPPLPWHSFDMSEDEAAEMLAGFVSIDILISHSPPKGVADRHAAAGSIGSEAVREAVARLQPDFVFCGHVHDCWGERGEIGRTKVANLGPSVNWFEVDR